MRRKCFKQHADLDWYGRTVAHFGCNGTHAKTAQAAPAWPGRSTVTVNDRSLYRVCSIDELATIADTWEV